MAITDRSEEREVVEPQEPDLPDNWQELFDAKATTAEEEEVAQEEEEEPAPSKEDLLKARQELEEWRKWGAEVLRRQQNVPQQQQIDPVEVAFKRLKEKYPGANEEVVTFLRDAFSEVLPAMTAPVVNEVRNLKSAHQTLQNKGVLEEFDKHLDTLFTAKKLPNSLRRQFKNDIYLEGYKRYGAQFDESKATRLFTEAYNDYAKESMKQKGEYVTQKTRKTNNSPPVTDRGEGGNAIDDVHKKIVTSKKRENDFGGGNWRTMVLKKLARGS